MVMFCINTNICILPLIYKDLSILFLLTFTIDCMEQTRGFIYLLVKYNCKPFPSTKLNNFIRTNDTNKNTIKGGKLQCH